MASYASAPQWHWDSSRQLRYYVVHVQGGYTVTYETGETDFRPSPVSNDTNATPRYNQYSQVAFTEQGAHQRHQSDASATDYDVTALASEMAHMRVSSGQNHSLSGTSDGRPYRPQDMPSMGYGTYNPMPNTAYGGAAYNPLAGPSNATAYSSTSSHAHNQDSQLYSHFNPSYPPGYGSMKQTYQPQAHGSHYQSGISTHRPNINNVGRRTIGAVQNNIIVTGPRVNSKNSKLDKSFQKRGKNFFKVGVVFKALWPENAGDIGEGSEVTTNFIMGESIYAKIRWFVIIREGHNSCACLPIQTYGGRGVAKPNEIKSHHSIIYTGDMEPSPTPGEMPNVARGEEPMGQSIKVTTTKKHYKMDSMSRVNFHKIYTVEHKVKVYDFGKVHPSWEVWLLYQFKLAWNMSGTAIPEGIENIPEEEEEEEEDEEEEEGEDSDDYEDEEAEEGDEEAEEGEEEAEEGEEEDEV